MSLPATFWVHQVQVEQFLGTKSGGASVYDAPVTVRGFLERHRRFVRSASGEQVVAESTFYTDVGNAALLKTRSRVTVAGDPPTTVITCAVNDSGPLGLPDHVAAALQ